MRKVTLVAAALALGLAGAGAGGAGAGAFPTPFATLSDASGDALGGAPDLTGLTVGYEGSDVDAVVMQVQYAGDQLPDGSHIVLGLDTDRNAATGSDGGADYLIELEPASGNVVPSFWRWKGGSYQEFQVRNPAITAVKGGVALLVFCLCDLNHPTALRIFARGESADGSASDSMPDTGAADLNVPVVSSVNYSIPFPTAGSAFWAEVHGVRLAYDRLHLVPAESATCSAKLAGKQLALTGHCRWHLPADTKGKRLALTIKVTYKGGASTFVQSYPVS